jgi:glyoxylase-like metal-dependent hydrolase (beta-lactamase superfamily II)
MGRVIIVKNTGGIAATNAYLVADAEAKQAVIFDAPDNTVGPLLDAAEERGFDVIGLWLTHGHFDHVAGHAEVTKRFPNAKVLIHKLDEPKLQEPGSQFFVLPFTIPPRSADGYVEDGQTLTFGKQRVDVIFTPGHSPGHVMYHFPDEKLLIGGDLIIGGAIGRTDLPDSDHAELERSVRKVMQLPPGTRLLPGHCDVSTLDMERTSNPYVQEILRGG